MVSMDGLPDYFQNILRTHCPHVLYPGYLLETSIDRHIDHFEIYSGMGRLSKAVEEAMFMYMFMFVSGIVCFDVVPAFVRWASFVPPSTW